LAVAQARLAQAQRENGYAITRAQLSLQQAEAELEYTQMQQDSYGSAQEYQHSLQMAETAVSVAEVELEYLMQGVDPELEIEVQKAQELMAWMQIIAPVDGEVRLVSIYPGRPVERFKPVIVVADTSSIEVSASLSNDQIDGLSEGQQVTVTLEADPAETWIGSIRSLPYPFGSGDEQVGTGDTVALVRIQLDGPLGEAMLGEQVQITAVLQEREDVLWLPPEAVQTLQGRDFVMVYEDSRQRRVDVELGLKGVDRLEILDGVEEGSVIVAPQDTNN
jgi:multidrug efflux pump subunit AcrA (membrane-fusion protein)